MKSLGIKTLEDLKWIPMSGDWETGTSSTIIFKGGEYDPPISSFSQGETVNENALGLAKFVNYGQLMFNERFSEGYIKAQVMFDSPDYRSNASIVIQHDVANRSSLMFGMSGGFRPIEKGTGFLYMLLRWSRNYNRSIDGQTSGGGESFSFTDLFKDGEGRNLKGNQFYDIEIRVKGALISASVNEVEVMRHILDQPALLSDQVGLFCGSRSDITFRDVIIQSEVPKAFVIMQFNTPEYEALYSEVIEPLCINVGLRPYRGDSTFLPGLIIEDIKKQIQEARIVIAEITPSNANVYFEVGFADALNKPIILIADKRDGLKPFDVRAYRTIFYDNSIGGKKKVENDLRSYLDSILGR